MDFYFKQTRNRVSPLSANRDNSISDRFPYSPSTLTNLETDTSSSFNSARDKILHHLNDFEKDYQSNGNMFVDHSPFISSIDHPHSLSESRNSNMFSRGFSGETEESEPQQQPRVFNIPIQVETPEGFVPLIRSNSISAGLPYNRNRVNDSPASSSVHFNPVDPATERMSEGIRHFSGCSPTPPPKPKFNHHPSHQAEFPAHYPFNHHIESNPGYHQPHVHAMPIKIEKSQRTKEPVYTESSFVPNYFEPRQSASFPVQDSPRRRRFRETSESEEKQSSLPHTVTIPITIEKSAKKKEPSPPPVTETKPIETKPVETQPVETKKSSSDPIEMIKEIEKETCRLEKEVIEFSGEYLDKKYRYLDEMLTRCMIKLDSIDSNGCDEVRSARRSALAHVDHCIAILEREVNKPKEEENFDENASEMNKQKEAEQKSDVTNEVCEAEFVNSTAINQEPLISDPTVNSQDEESDNSADDNNQMEIENISGTNDAITVNINDEAVQNGTSNESCDVHIDNEGSSNVSTKVNHGEPVDTVDQFSPDPDTANSGNSEEPKVEEPTEYDVPPKDAEENKERINVGIKSLNVCEGVINENESVDDGSIIVTDNLTPSSTEVALIEEEPKPDESAKN